MTEPVLRTGRGFPHDGTSGLSESEGSLTTSADLWVLVVWVPIGGEFVILVFLRVRSRLLSEKVMGGSESSESSDSMSCVTGKRMGRPISIEGFRCGSKSTKPSTPPVSLADLMEVSNWELARARDRRSSGVDAPLTVRVVDANTLSS